jgi:hypothetical protein
MKENENKETTTKPTEARFDENAVCGACGAFGAFHFGDRTLCQNCYEGCGSCCPEFGKDDLWASQKND